MEWIGLAAGGVAGCVHAGSLWHGSRTLRWWTPLLGLARIGIVAAVLVMAARQGTILSAALGWGVGMLVLTPLILLYASRQRAPRETPGL